MIRIKLKLKKMTKNARKKALNVCNILSTLEGIAFFCLVE